MKWQARLKTPGRFFGALLLGGCIACLVSCRLLDGEQSAAGAENQKVSAPAQSVVTQSVAAPKPAALNSAANVGVADIPDVSPYAQVVALSDNHGMIDNLKRLLVSAKITDAEGHWAAGKTLVIVVGDLIDKGPHSLEVLDLWMRLTDEATPKGGRVVVLLGNHEAEFLADPNNNKAAPLRSELHDRSIALDTLTDSGQPRGRFLRDMPLAARVGGKWLFCHAGWPPDMKWNEFTTQARMVLQAGDYANPLLLADNSILEKRAGKHGGKWWDDDRDVNALEDRLTRMGLTGVVFGHQPQAFDMIGDVGPRSAGDHRLVKIDSGMAPDAGAHPGRLLVFPNPQELTQDAPPAHILSVGP